MRLKKKIRLLMNEMYLYSDYFSTDDWAIYDEIKVLRQRIKELEK